MRRDVTEVLSGNPTVSLDHLVQEILKQGWEAPKVTTTGSGRDFEYVAESHSSSDRAKRTGPDEITALQNLLLYIMRKQYGRTAAQYKAGMWNTDWTNQLQPIAEAYAKAPVYDPKAAGAWTELANDSVARAKQIQQQINVEVVDDPEPYKSVQEMCDDVHRNRHFYVSRANSEHPVWSVEQNVAFRTVHDVLGHCVSGGDFGWQGENLACRAHFPLLSPNAQQALFTECIGQTCYAAYYRAFGPQKVAYLSEFIEPAQAKENDPGHAGVHPQNTVAPAAMPSVEPSPPVGLDEGYVAPHQEGLGLTPVLTKHTVSSVDPNAGWNANVQVPETNGYLSYGDPLQAQAVMDNAAKIDTGWSKLTREDGTPDEARMKQAIVNAFRVVLLSPRKDLRWNAIHYQDIASVPNDVDDPKVYWDTLEARRRAWNSARGRAEGAHLVYWKPLQKFYQFVKAHEPELDDAEVRQRADEQVWHMRMEAEQRLEAEGKRLPPDELERKVDAEVAKQLDVITRPKMADADTPDYGPQGEFFSHVESAYTQDWYNTQFPVAPHAWGSEGDTMFRQLPSHGPGEGLLTGRNDDYNRFKQQLADNYAAGHIDEDALMGHLMHADSVAAMKGDQPAPHPDWKSLIGNRIKTLHNQYAQDPDSVVGDLESQIDRAYRLGEHYGVDPFDVRTAAETPNNARPWRPGETGKGALYGDDVYAWATDSLDSLDDPHHLHVRWQMKEEQGREPDAEFWISPAGEYDLLPRLMPGRNIDDWKRDVSRRIEAEGFKPVGDDHEWDTGNLFSISKTAAGGQTDIFTGEDAGLYGAWMGSHLKAIAQVSRHVDEILDAALEDVHDHDATGHHFRAKVLQLGIQGVGPKVASFAWLLLQPLTSQLATVDTHMMDVLGHDYKKEMSDRDYFKFERELAAGRDAAGYGHVPLGAFQWGMWDNKRTGPNSHQDHSAMRVLDPVPHQDVDWAQKTAPLNVKGEDWTEQAPEWWQLTQPARDAVGAEWDTNVAPQFPRNALPFKESHVSIHRTAAEQPEPDDELHVAIDVPNHVRERISHWVDQLEWDGEYELEDPGDYHITVFYAKSGHSLENREWAEQFDVKGYPFRTVGVDAFDSSEKDLPKAIVLRLEAPEFKRWAEWFIERAKERGLDVSEFPGGYKPHVTVAYAEKKPKGPDPDVQFRGGSLYVSTPRRIKTAEREWPGWPKAQIGDPITVPLAEGGKLTLRGEVGERRQDPAHAQLEEFGIGFGPPIKGHMNIERPGQRPEPITFNFQEAHRHMIGDHDTYGNPAGAYVRTTTDRFPSEEWIDHTMPDGSRIRYAPPSDPQLHHTVNDDGTTTLKFTGLPDFDPRGEFPYVTKGEEPIGTVDTDAYRQALELMHYQTGMEGFLGGFGYGPKGKRSKLAYGYKGFPHWWDQKKPVTLDEAKILGEYARSEGLSKKALKKFLDDHEDDIRGDKDRVKDAIVTKFNRLSAAGWQTPPGMKPWRPGLPGRGATVDGVEYRWASRGVEDATHYDALAAILGEDNEAKEIPRGSGFNLTAVQPDGTVLDAENWGQDDDPAYLDQWRLGAQNYRELKGITFHDGTEQTFPGTETHVGYLQKNGIHPDDVKDYWAVYTDGSRESLSDVYGRDWYKNEWGRQQKPDWDRLARTADAAFAPKVFVDRQTGEQQATRPSQVSLMGRLREHYGLSTPEIWAGDSDLYEVPDSVLSS